MRILVRLLILNLLIATTGCNDRAMHISREAADRQAQQNTAMADLNKEVSRGSRDLVAADAQAREGIIAVHRDLQSERTRLDASREEVESERKNLAAERRLESLLLPVLSTAGSLAVTLLALGFCWRALIRADQDVIVDAELNKILLAEVLADDSPIAIEAFRPAPYPEDLPAH
jgi:hypothetical protein